MAGSVYQSRYVETIVKTIDMKFEEQSRKQQERTEQLIISGINKKESSATIQGKKERFLKLSGITFHYVNRSQLEDLYYQFFQEPIIEGYALERTDEKDLGLRAQLPSNILGGGVDNKNVGKLTGNIKVPESLQGKFLRYQKERIIQNQVILGLEEVDI